MNGWLWLIPVTLITMIQAGQHEPSRINEEEFIDTYSVSAELSSLLDQHSSTIGKLIDKIHKTKRKKHGVWQFPWLPGYFVKYNISRVTKRNLIEDCINTYNLDLMHVPKKLLYHIKGRADTLDSSNYAVVIEKVYRDKQERKTPLTLTHVIQFCKLIEETGHTNPCPSNYFRIANNRLSFIDTDGVFDKEFAVRGIAELLNCNIRSHYQPEALSYILDKIAYHYVQLPSARKRFIDKRIAKFIEYQRPDTAHAIRRQLGVLIAKYKEQNFELSSSD